MTYADDEDQKSHHRDAFAYPSDNCPEKILHSIFLYSKYTKELRKYCIQIIVRRSQLADAKLLKKFVEYGDRSSEV